ncbi:MAG TPA: phytoene/squalene synthase family protein [Balneolaceae bacterium]|nr:phytoene/squalene synthase family protein [Balneolaceae bacterium]
MKDKKSNSNTNTVSKSNDKDGISNLSYSSQRIKNFRENYSDTELQSYLLENVSRTFALTIPELPDPLIRVVSNAYLLCRIVDTVEDEPNLTLSQKENFCSRFIDVVSGTEDPVQFSRDLAPYLSNETLETEKELILLTDRVINITHQFNERQQKAMERCIRIMADGMAFFQQQGSKHGLRNLQDVNKYCYYVAGVVGEMLTELFCIYSPAINENHDELMDLAVSFGQGLQMTNILKDVWEDYDRSACWLPRNYFENDLANLEQGKSTEDFKEGIDELIGVTHGHLQDAMSYILLIPAEEKGIRRFCYWAVGMAILTIKKIHKNLEYTNGDEVKISRKSVKATILFTNITVGSNRLLKLLFDATRWGLPDPRK